MTIRIEFWNGIGMVQKEKEKVLSRTAKAPMNQKQ